MERLLISAVLAMFFLSGCVSPSLKKSHQLTDFQRIEPGTHTKKSIRNWLGEPARVLSMRDFPETNRKGESWTYYDAGDPYIGTSAGRLGITFEEDKDVVRSVTWHVKEGELESELSNAKKSMGSFPLTQKSAEWLNPHAGPSEEYFENKDRGVSIVVELQSNRVRALTKFDPAFDTSSLILDKTKPNPVFCVTTDACASMPKLRSTAGH